MHETFPVDFFFFYLQDAYLNDIFTIAISLTHTYKHHSCIWIDDWPRPHSWVHNQHTSFIRWLFNRNGMLQFTFVDRAFAHCTEQHTLSHILHVVWFGVNSEHGLNNIITISFHLSFVQGVTKNWTYTQWWRQNEKKIVHFIDWLE